MNKRASLFLSFAAAFVVAGCSSGTEDPGPAPKLGGKPPPVSAAGSGGGAAPASGPGNQAGSAEAK